MSPVRQPEATRAKILETALSLFHEHGYKGTSINDIVEASGLTKGALFHHFKGKIDLVYAIVDELFMHEIQNIWVAPVQNADDPITAIGEVLQGFVARCSGDSRYFECGCPVNNLAQEMSATDEGFRLRLRGVLQQWEDGLARGLQRGIDQGAVRADVDPQVTAAVLVALFEGCIGSLKVHRDFAQLDKLTVGCRLILDSLRP